MIFCHEIKLNEPFRELKQHIKSYALAYNHIEALRFLESVQYRNYYLIKYNDQHIVKISYYLIMVTV